MLRPKLTVLVVSICLAALSGSARAGIIVYGGHASHHVAPGSSLLDVRMSVDMSVTAGKATFTFTNVSVSPEESAVFKLIVLDTFDDDTGTSVLSNAVILHNAPGVSYSLRPSPTLPGYNNILRGDDGMVGFRANPPAPRKGAGPGESLQVLFDTPLADGSDIDDYLAFFDAGQDTGTHSIGFHAINADTVRCGSLSGLYDPQIPEPSSLALIGLGAIVSVFRRRRKRIIRARR